MEARVEAKINEVQQDTTSLLEELKTTVATVHESQEKMGQAMERMSNELQELVQRDAGIEGEEEIDPLLVTTNWDENLPAPIAKSLMELPLFLHLLPGFLEYQKWKRKQPVLRTLLPPDCLPKDMKRMWRPMDSADAQQY